MSRARIPIAAFVAVAIAAMGAWWWSRGEGSGPATEGSAIRDAGAGVDGDGKKRKKGRKNEDRGGRAEEDVIQRTVMLPDGGVLLLSLPAVRSTPDESPSKNADDTQTTQTAPELAEEATRAAAKKEPQREIPDAGAVAYTLVINEVMARNLTTTVDERGEFDDWVELHNLSDREVPLEGVILTDQPDDPKRAFVMGSDLKIAPRGYLVVFADGQPKQGPLHANFKLAATQGDLLLLVSPRGRLLDEVAFGPQPPDVSMGRIPDGLGPLVALYTPTPGAPNVKSDPPDAGAETPDAAVARDAGASSATGVVINEYLADNIHGVLDEFGEPEDWIELFNTTTAPQDLSGHHLTDSVEKLQQWTFPRGTTIAPQGFLIIHADEHPHQGPLHANFKLSARGEQVMLVDPRGNVLEAVTFGVQRPDVSEGRVPNGTGIFRPLLVPTPGAPNPDPPDAGLPTDAGPRRPDAGRPDAGLAGPEEVVINEWMASNQGGLTDERGEFEDWIELYNTASRPARLEGACLSDDEGAARKWCFPAGVTVGPLGFLLVIADNEPDGPLHATFKLNASGETIVFAGPDGNPIDVQAFAQQQPDRSMGRVPDGAGAVVTLPSPSPGSPNTAP